MENMILRIFARADTQDRNGEANLYVPVSL